MEETPVTIIGIIVASILMFIVPFVLIADRHDDISQLTVKTLTSEFVDNVVKTGTLTNEDYMKYMSRLNSSGNDYEVDIEIKVLDENTAQRTTNNSTDGSIGINSYYSIYTTQVEEQLNINNTTGTTNSGKIILKEGDVISVTAKNSSKTISQSLKNIYYTVKGEDIPIILGTGTGTIVKNGAT